MCPTDGQLLCFISVSCWQSSLHASLHSGNVVDQSKVEHAASSSSLWPPAIPSCLGGRQIVQVPNLSPSVCCLQGTEEQQQPMPMDFAITDPGELLPPCHFYARRRLGCIAVCTHEQLPSKALLEYVQQCCICLEVLLCLSAMPAFTYGCNAPMQTS